ncbi:hypothetical protein M8494_29265 [Serratia ureilytica]
MPDSVAIVEALYPYIERELSSGTYLGHITRHILGLFRRARRAPVASPPERERPQAGRRCARWWSRRWRWCVSRV